MTDESFFLKQRNKELEKRIKELEASVEDLTNHSKQILDELINDLSLPNDTTLENLSSSIKKYVYNSISDISSPNKIKINPIQTKSPQNRSISQSPAQNTTLGKLQSEIDKLNTENAQLRLTILNMNKEKSKTKQNEVREKGKMTSKSEREFLLEDSVQSLSLELEEARDRNAEQKARIDELKAALSVSAQTIRKLHEQCFSLQKTNEELINKQENAQNTQYARNDLEREIKKLREREENNKQVIDGLTNTLKDTTNDLETEGMFRDKLIKLVYKQVSTLDSFTVKLAEANDKIAQKEEANLELEKRIKELEKALRIAEPEAEKVASDLCKFISATATTHPKIIDRTLECLMKDGSPTNRIRDAFASLINYCQSLQYQPANQPTEHTLSHTETELYSCVKSLMNFLRTTIDSREIQDWLSGKEFAQQTKQELMCEIKRIDAFLMENCSKLVEESPLYSSFFARSDSITLEDQLSNYLELHGMDAFGEDDKEPTKEDQQNMFLMLQTATLANDVLRKYGERIKDQCEVLGHEVAKTRRQIGLLNDDIDSIEKDRKIESLEEDKTQMQEVLDEISTIISKCIDNRASLPKAILAIHNYLKGGQAMEITSNNDYINPVNSDDSDDDNPTTPPKKNSPKDTTISKLTKENKNLSKALKRCHSELIQCNEEKEKSIKKINKDFDSYKATAENRIMQLSQLLQKADNDKKQIESRLKTQLQTMKKDYEATIDQMNNDMVRLKQSAEHAIHATQQSAKQELRCANQEAQNQAEQANSLRRRYESMVNDLREKVNMKNQIEIENRQRIHEQEEQIKDLQSKLTTLDISAKMQTMKHRTELEKQKRESAIEISKLQAKIIADEREHKAKLEKCKEDLTEEKIKEMKSYAKPFAQILDIYEPNDIESIFITAQNELRMLKQSQQQFSIAIHENSRVSNFLAGEQFEFESISDAVQKLVKANKDLQSKNEMLSSGLAQSQNAIITARVLKESDRLLKEWDAWSRKVYSMLTEQPIASKSTKEIRGALEEALITFSSMSDSPGSDNNFRQPNALVSKKILKQLNSLRLQKQIFLLNISLKRKKNFKCKSFRNAIFSVCFIYRLQKKSGHLHLSTSIPFSPFILSEKKPEENSPKPKNYPILNCI